MKFTKQFLFVGLIALFSIISSGSVGILKANAIIITNPVCDYAAPPDGCNYVPGPNYNSTNFCGMVLNCPARAMTPTIANVTPNQAGPNNTISITGANLESVTGLAFYDTSSNWLGTIGMNIVAASSGTSLQFTFPTAPLAFGVTAGSRLIKAVNASGFSNAVPFTVTSPTAAPSSFSIFSPTSANSFVTGGQIPVTWTSQNYSGSNVSIILRGASTHNAGDTTPVNAGTVFTLVPNTGSASLTLSALLPSAAGQYYIRVYCDTVSSNCYPADSQVFTVSAPATAPSITNVGVSQSGPNFMDLTISGTNLTGTTALDFNGPNGYLRIPTSAISANLISIGGSGTFWEVGGLYKVAVVTDTGTTNALQFSLVARATAVPTLSFSKDSFLATYVQGTPLPSSDSSSPNLYTRTPFFQEITFTNTSNVPANYTITVPNQPAWLNSSYNTNQLTLGAGVIGSIGVYLNPASVANTVGTYTTNIIVTGNFANSPKVIPVTLTVVVAAPGPTLPTLMITYPQDGVGYNSVPTPLKWQNSIPMNLNTSYSVQMKVVKAAGYSAGDIIFTTTLTNVQAGCSNSDVCSYPLTWSLPGTYAITVKNLGNNASNTITFIVVGPLDTPVVTISALPTSVALGGYTTVTWSSTNATSCTASGTGWTGARALSGSQDWNYPTNASFTSQTYTLTCAGLGGTGSNSVTVVVAAPVAGAPTITRIEPGSGPKGTIFKVFGTNLAGATSVGFLVGGVAAGDVDIIGAASDGLSLKFSADKIINLNGYGTYQIRAVTPSGWSNYLPVITTYIAELTPLSFSHDALTATYIQGAPLPSTEAGSPNLYTNTPFVQPFKVTNVSNDDIISFMITVPNQPAWLNTIYSTVKLTLNGGQVMEIGAYLDPTTVANTVGTYTTNIILTGNFADSPKIIPVTLVVKSKKDSIECEYAHPREGYHYEGMKPYPVCGGRLVKDTSSETSTVPGCTRRIGFSTTTRQRCDTTVTTIPIGGTPLPADVDTQKAQGSCLDLQNNLRYRMRDAQVNNEVSSFQDFLQTNNYLNSEPTGFFGIMTLKAAKDFQKASSISPTGFIGALTRAKIKALTCTL